MSSLITALREWLLDVVGIDRDEAHGSYYHDYPLGHPDEIMSPEWTARRSRWLQEYREQSGGEPVCAVCERPWTLSDDLHHRTYMHLGEELFAELVPLCRADHEKVHEAFESRVSWLRQGRQYATDVLVARLHGAAANEVALLNVESADQ